MKFSSLAKVFDTIQATDAYTGRKLFKCQPAAFETSNPEGSVSKRRVMSVAPGLGARIPLRRCLSFLGETWIVGDGSTDGMFGEAVRESYWLKKSTSQLTYQTPGQAAVGTAGTTAHALVEYLKDTVDGITTAEYFAQYEVYMAKTETPVRNGYLRSPTRLYRIRATRDALAGFVMISADDIGIESELTATFTTSTYDPVTDSKTVVSVAVPALLFSRSKEYDQQTAADPLYLAGDHTLIVAKASTTPVVGQEVAANGLTWKVEQLSSQQDAWSLHLRRR